MVWYNIHYQMAICSLMRFVHHGLLKHWMILLKNEGYHLWNFRKIYELLLPTRLPVLCFLASLSEQVLRRNFIPMVFVIVRLFWKIYLHTYYIYEHFLSGCVNHILVHSSVIRYIHPITYPMAYLLL